MQHGGSVVISRSEDRIIYNGLIESLFRKGEKDTSVAGLMITIGKYFLGAPYESNTLETKGEETLVINLREFDCFTFVENVVVLAGLINEGNYGFEDYAALLERIRYRDGILQGYPSRLHYFTDWLFANEKKGIIKDITREIGGEHFQRKIYYMTVHRDNYPLLGLDSSYRELLAIERNLSERPLYYIPKAELKRLETAIVEGDVIAMTTSIEGLDVVHVGFAIHRAKGIFLLHASEIEKKVVISDTTLYQYISDHEAMTGIMVGRLRQVCQNDGNLLMT